MRSYKYYARERQGESPPPAAIVAVGAKICSPRPTPSPTGPLLAEDELLV